MRNAHLATKDSTSRPENGRIEGGLSSEVIKMKDDSPLSGPGELDLAKLVDEVLGEMPGPGSAESGKMPLYQPNTLPLEMSPHAARLALEEAQRAKEKRRKEAEELGQMKTAAAPMEVLDLQRAAADAVVVPGLAVKPAPKPASVVVAPAAPAPSATSTTAAAPASSKEAKPINVRSAEVKDSAKATVLTTAKALEKRSSAGRWVMIGMGLVAVAAASTAGWLAYKKSPLLGHASAATPVVTAPATTAAAPATPPAETNAASASAAAEAKPPATAEAKTEEPKPEAKAAAPEAKPAEAKTEEPTATATPKPKRKVTASAPAPEPKAEEPAPKPAAVAKAPEPKAAPVAKAPDPKPAPEAKPAPAAAPAQPSSVDAILQQQLKGAIP